jgi:hypothetical protein
MDYILKPPTRSQHDLDIPLALHKTQLQLPLFGATNIPKQNLSAKQNFNSRWGSNAVPYSMDV